MYLTQIKTKKDIIWLTENLDLLSSSLYSSDKPDLTQILDKKFDYRFGDIVYDLLSNKGVSKDDLTTKSIEELIEEMRDGVSNVPIVDITLAFYPNREFINLMWTKVKEYTQNPCALNILYEPEILGGLKMTYNGKFIDLSLSKKLSKYEF